MFLVGVVGATTPAPAAADPRDPAAYRPPVSGPVIDPFRPPPRPWMAGNRGIDYATIPGTLVGAIGPGRVAFAGAVAGRLAVTVDHPDGLRSSYVWLATIDVRVGDQVVAGDPVGRSGTVVHLGVRRGDTYLDPASLWGTRATVGHVVLVPDASAGPDPGRGGAPGLTPGRPPGIGATGTTPEAGHRVGSVVDRPRESGPHAGSTRAGATPSVAAGRPARLQAGTRLLSAVASRLERLLTGPFLGDPGPGR